jgi:hypothetical protein
MKTVIFVRKEDVNFKKGIFVKKMAKDLARSQGLVCLIFIEYQPRFLLRGGEPEFLKQAATRKVANVAENKGV